MDGPRASTDASYTDTGSQRQQRAKGSLGTRVPSTSIEIQIRFMHKAPSVQLVVGQAGRSAFAL